MSRLLQAQPTRVMLSWVAGLSMVSIGMEFVVVVVVAAVRSQCFLMKMGISENALKRWILICALQCWLARA